MRLDSARALKLQVALEVFAPIARRLLERAMARHVDLPLPIPPLQRIALGIAKGQGFGDFTLAVRLQSHSDLLHAVVERVRALAKSEINVGFVGRVTPQSAGALEPADLRQVRRPLVIGCSVAHVAGTAGTLGMIARHRKTGRAVMLSNSHVLAQAGLAKPGDAVTQPGRIDGGASDDHVAALLDFVPLKTAGSNQVDAAVAVLDDSIPFETLVPGIGVFAFSDAEQLAPGQRVRKLGRTTGLTTGEITVTELDDLAVDYDIGTLVFDNQIEIKGLPGVPFSRSGDSGSLVIDDDAKAIGLLFSGSPDANEGAGVSYATPLPRVLASLDLEPL